MIHLSEHTPKLSNAFNTISKSLPFYIFQMTNKFLWPTTYKPDTYINP